MTEQSQQDQAEVERRVPGEPRRSCPPASRSAAYAMLQGEGAALRLGGSGPWEPAGPPAPPHQAGSGPAGQPAGTARETTR